MALFDTIIDISAYNAILLWMEIDPDWNKGVSFKRRLFLQELGMSLVQSNLAVRPTLPRTPNAKHVCEAARADLNTTAAPDQSQPSKRRRCYLCKADNKVSTVCCQCQKYACKQHDAVTYKCNTCVSKAVYRA